MEADGTEARCDGAPDVVEAGERRCQSQSPQGRPGFRGHGTDIAALAEDQPGFLVSLANGSHGESLYLGLVAIHAE